MKKYFGEILTVIGVGLVSYNVFSFSHKTSEGLCLPSLCERISGVVYFYNHSTLTLISIGCTLVVVGILIIKNK
jgi:hypothetical protein